MNHAEEMAFHVFEDRLESLGLRDIAVIIGDIGRCAFLGGLSEGERDDGKTRIFQLTDEGRPQMSLGSGDNVR